MANPRNPNDPYRPFPTDDELRKPAEIDDGLQPDPELAEGPASNRRVAILAVSIAIVLGAVFYGLNNSSINTGTHIATSQTAPATPAANNDQNTADFGKSAVPPGVRDVTPYNHQPGTTTGTAPPPQPPASAPAAK